MSVTDDELRYSAFYDKALGSLLGGLIGDAIGTPTEGKDYHDIEQQFGWVSDFSSDGTDDTVMKNLLAEALVRTDGYAGADDWALVWLDQWDKIFGDKFAKFFISVINAARKLRYGVLPRMAALGNLPSSSSAMCISPVGIVNACNPRQAAMQAYSLASLIHTYDAGFCQDGAACMAAAVSAAMIPGTTVDAVIDAAMTSIVPVSGREMLGRIELALSLVRRNAEYRAFRAATYEHADELFCTIGCDSRETIPLTIALLQLAGGDVETCVTYAANFGRDSDTMGAMCGAIAGALNGVQGIKESWVRRAQEVTTVSQTELALSLCRVAMVKQEREQAAGQVLQGLVAARG